MRGQARETRRGRRPRSASASEVLARRIDGGEFAPGSRLPSEPDLAAQLGISRATLRDALRVLEGDGLVRRRRGSGTYVTRRPKVANSLDLNFGVTEAIRAAGMQAGTQQARTWVEPADPFEAERLGLEPGQDVQVVERVRTADGRPVVLSRDLVPVDLLKGHPDAPDAMSKRSVYEMLETDLGVVVHHGVARFRPVLADRSLAGPLDVTRGTLLLYLWQVDYDGEGTAVLSSHEYHLADSFDFSVVRRGPGRRYS